ncbi:hypothetical protein PCC7424_2393 [Gloeothece citriformis PCC 7424]|uniref:Uncharacterized protein n=1 Tax=Gloeothece citriformis (strain PCC 7424) TaxID=65393 RepID=B7KIX8_GLOC7|nr:hypothetical protein [Gloeothece citriformis]ACK70814.1 hypothetical protein PCC7424_2393 [Gloeothece citriformis PCC 7424]
MDFHLDGLLHLPHVTVLTYQQQEGFIILIIDFLNEGIICPYCQIYTDNLHLSSPDFSQRFITFWTGSLPTSSTSSIYLSALRKISN